MTNFFTHSYTLTSEISTLLYTLSLKKVLHSGWIPPDRPLQGVPLQGGGETSDKIYHTNRRVHHIANTFVLAGVLRKSILAAVAHFHLFVTKATLLTGLNKSRKWTKSLKNKKSTLSLKSFFKHRRIQVASIQEVISRSVSFKALSDLLKKR